MKLGKKLLAVVVVMSVMLTVAAIPASAFTGSTVAMPTDFSVIENFDGENTLGWESHGSTLEFSDAYGYGTSGKSAHVSWSASGWNGFKTRSSLSIVLEKTGLAFWAYNAGNELTNFCVVLLQGSTKYEAKITLKAGEAVYQIPWTDFVKNGVSVDTTQIIRQIDFTKSAGSADYYIDQIGCYNKDGEEPPFIASKVAMPDNYTLIDNFDTASSLSWSANKSTAELSADRGYGEAGKSMHVSWNASNWCGFKTSSNQSIALSGDGLAFWAYNAGGSDLTNFCIVLLQGSTKYEAKITLKAGEEVYKIPWTDFVKNGVSVDTTAIVRQIEFTKSAAFANYFIDELGCYADVPVIEEFESSKGTLTGTYKMGYNIPISFDVAPAAAKAYGALVWREGTDEAKAVDVELSAGNTVVGIDNISVYGIKNIFNVKPYIKNVEGTVIYGDVFTASYLEWLLMYKDNTDEDKAEAVAQINKILDIYYFATDDKAYDGQEWPELADAEGEYAAATALGIEGESAITASAEKPVQGSVVNGTLRVNLDFGGKAGTYGVLAYRAGNEFDAANVSNADANIVFEENAILGIDVNGIAVANYAKQYTFVPYVESDAGVEYGNVIKVSYADFLAYALNSDNAHGRKVANASCELYKAIYDADLCVAAE